MSDYTISIPQIDSLTISSNPVNVGVSFKISVSVSEITQILKPIEWYSGEIYTSSDYDYI